MKLSVLIAQYVAHRKSLGDKFYTQEKCLKLFDRSIGKNSSITDVTDEKVNAFLYGKEHSITGYWFKKYSTLSGFYRYNINRGYVNNSPLPKTLPKRPQSIIPYIYTRDELRRIFKGALTYQKRKSNIHPYMIRTILILLYGTGLRIGEALSLTNKDVDLNQAVLVIRETKFYKTRLVPFDEVLKKIIIEYSIWRRKHGGSRNENETFFLDENGKFICLDTIEIIFRRIRRYNDIKRIDNASFQPRLHDFRHTFAVHHLTKWYQNKQDVNKLLPILSVYMGHAQLSATSVYLTMTVDLLREAGKYFEQYVIGVKNEE